MPLLVPLGLLLLPLAGINRYMEDENKAFGAAFLERAAPALLETVMGILHARAAGAFVTPRVLQLAL